MQIIQKAVQCKDKQAYYELHLAIINPLLPNSLTDKEIKILASFMAIDEKLVEDDRFNSLVRKKIMEKHKLSAGGLGNYLKSMIKKGFLTKSKITGRIKIKPFMIPEPNMQGYQFKIGYEIVKKNIEKVISNTSEEEVRLTPPKEGYQVGEENNFDHASTIIDEEDEENEQPYKMEE
jgi:hypothetical protein